MFTQCPHCQAIFQISAEQLKAAGGDVRCGQCLTVFNALNRLSEELPEQDAAQYSRDVGDYNQWAAEALASTLAEDRHPGADEAASEPLFVDETTPAEATFDQQPAPAQAAEDSVGAPDTDDAAAPAGIDNADTAVNEQEEHSPLTPAETTVETNVETELAGDVASDSLTQDSTETPAESVDTVAPDTVGGEADTGEGITDIDLDAIAAWEQSPVAASSEIAGEDSPAEAEADDRSVRGAGDDTAPSERQELGDIGLVSADLEADFGRVEEDEFAEFAQLAEPMNNDEVIIIEEEDLAPLSSQGYRDGLSERSASAADLGENDAAGETDITAAGPEVEVSEAASEQGIEEQATTTEAATANETADTAQAATEADRPSRPVPAVILDELHAAKAERLRPSNTPWVVGTVLLMLLLALQVGYYSRDDLARDPTLRPWLIKLCQLTGCTLSQPYDISLIDIIGRDVRSHPTARKALIASTTLINNASFVQPYPLLTLVFSDITGTELARRRFTPREYLSSDIDIAAGMAPDTPVRIELELVDPGKAAVNYEFHAELDPRIRRPLS